MSVAGPAEITSALSAELGPRERLLWSGQPRQGWVFGASEWMVTAFAIMWTGFAVFWEWSAYKSGAPLFFLLWGVPFVLVGLYMIGGRFYVDALQRERTY